MSRQRPCCYRQNLLGDRDVEEIAVEGIDISDVYLRETSRTIQADEPTAETPDASEPESNTAPPSDTVESSDVDDER